RRHGRRGLPGRPDRRLRRLLLEGREGIPKGSVANDESDEYVSGAEVVRRLEGTLCPDVSSVRNARPSFASGGFPPAPTPLRAANAGRKFPYPPPKRRPRRPPGWRNWSAKWPPVPRRRRRPNRPGQTRTRPPPLRRSVRLKERNRGGLGGPGWRRSQSLR